MIEVLLLDGENRSTLAACRSLGRRGLNVAVVGPANCITHTSKFCTQIIVQSSDKEAYISELKTLLRELRPSLFLPMTDHTMELISNDESIYSRSPLPNLQSLQTVQKKEKLLELCQDLSISIPKSQYVQSAADISNWSTFPAVLKTARAADVKRISKQKVEYFLTRKDLENHINTHQANSPWLLQEQIVGPGVGVFVLAEEGKVHATFCHRRILEKPPSGGVSVLSESIALKDAPVREAVKLVQSLGWTGVAMIEFKYCAEKRIPFLMEINPRFWGSLQLSISCGVDFPWLLYLMNKMELGSKEGLKALERARDYKVGNRLRWDLGTLDHLIIRLKNEGFPAVKNILRNNELHLSLSSRTIHETITGDDPEPFWQELKNYCGSIFT